jgi:hypothetical protein
MAGAPAPGEFVMSMALLVTFAVAYPMNRWLVRDHLKHGRLTMRLELAMSQPQCQSMAPPENEPRQHDAAEHDNESRTGRM